MNSRVEPGAVGRDVLARWMQGRWQRRDDATDQGAIESWLQLAWTEGVTALVARGLEQCPDAPVVLREAFGHAARAAAMSAMRQEAECRRVLERLAGDGIEVLVLKGTASAHWLYPAAYLRECSDIDLMADGHDQVERAAGALAGLGYATVYPPGAFGHTWLCARPFGTGRMEVDLHLRLSGMPLFADAFTFQELRMSAVLIPALGPYAHGLSPACAFLHACVHRVNNIVAGIGDRLKWLYEIHLLAMHLQEPDWRQVDDLAHAHGMCGACLSALEQASDCFGTQVPEAWRRSLQGGVEAESLDVARLRDWKYMQWKNLAALPSWRVRMSWLWQRLFPSAGYMQAVYGEPLGKGAARRLRWRRLLERLR